MPGWLSVLAAVSLAVAAVSAVLIVADVSLGRRQHMWIMNVVWPVTALWSGPRDLPRDGPVFWFMMQIAMFLGLATSYPVNWWLLRAGLKERM